MEEIKARLNNVADSYQGFVRAVLTYVKKKQSRMDAAYATEAGGIKAYSIYRAESQRERINS